VDFNRDIRPLLTESCYLCHGPDEDHREGDLRLDQRAAAMAERDGYSIIVPGKPDESELFARIVATDEDVRMPPPDAEQSLNPEQIEMVRRWIEKGAEWQDHWSFVPPRRPEVPSDSGASWPRNEIDHFVLARLRQAGLEPSPLADRRTQIRRLYLDLIGLPPTPDEVAAFVEDSDPRAYEQLVDRLLDSPHYGERMTLAWLDNARYADTNGFSIDGGRHMWLWRDWVIDAYNKNMPFDQFAVEQLAGDLLPDATVQQRVATGFNRNHMITHEGGTIPAENLVNYTVDRVKTTSAAFLGLTFGCAQCHDHKYDPLTQRDFYRFFAYFNTVDDRGLDGDGGRNASPKIKAHSVLGSAAEAKQIRAELAHLAAKLQQPLASQSDWEEAARRELAGLGKDI
jgi:hypothetical protein